MGLRPFSGCSRGVGPESSTDLPGRPGTRTVTRVLDSGRNNACGQPNIHLDGAAVDERRHGDVLGSSCYFGGIAFEKTGRLGLARRRRIRHGLSDQADRYPIADPDSVQPSFEAQNNSFLPARRTGTDGDFLPIQCRGFRPSVTARIRADRTTNGNYNQRLHGSLQPLSFLAVTLSHEKRYIRRINVSNISVSESAYPASCRWADQQLPSRSLIVSAQFSGALKFYTSRPIVRWDEITPGQWPVVKKHAAEKAYQWYALLAPHEVEAARSRLGGRWTKLGALDQTSLWRIDLNSEGDGNSVTAPLRGAHTFQLTSHDRASQAIGL